MKIVLVVIGVLIIAALTQLDINGTESKSKSSQPMEAVVDKAFHTDDLSTFVAAVKTAGLEKQLSEQTPITIFAPSDSAFASLPDGEFASLMDSKNKTKLKEIVRSHVVAGRISFSDLEDGQVVEAINGNKLKITLGNGESLVNNINLVKVNIKATNGIIHIMDGVMLASK